MTTKKFPPSFAHNTKNKEPISYPIVTRYIMIFFDVSIRKLFALMYCWLEIVLANFDCLANPNHVFSWQFEEEMRFSCAILDKLWIPWMSFKIDKKDSGVLLPLHIYHKLPHLKTLHIIILNNEFSSFPCLFLGKK